MSILAAAALLTSSGGASTSATQRLRNGDSSEELRADIDAARCIVCGTQGGLGDARQDRLDVFRNHLVATLEHRPGPCGVHDGEGGARRKAGEVIGRAAGVLDDRPHTDGPSPRAMGI